MQNCKDLADEFRSTLPRPVGELIDIAYPEGMDVYNPSVPFALDGRRLMAVRVELRENEDSDTLIYEDCDGRWQLLPGSPIFRGLQDPFVTLVKDSLLLGGVQVQWDGRRLVDYRTRFWHGKSLDSLQPVAQGPSGMKDIRVLELSDSRLAVFTRPQGESVMRAYGCIARIGLALVSSLDEVNETTIAGAELFDNLFPDDEWGGCNQLIELSNGLVGVVCHLAWREGETLHYCSGAFAVDVDTRWHSAIEVIGTRDCYPPGPAKEPRLADVCFTAGIERCSDGNAVLYSGLSDCRIGMMRIADPFRKFERG